MSANGAFSTTLDFEFFGGGYTTLAGGVSATIEPSLVSYAQVPITGTLSDFNLGFEFSGTITPPIIQASAENLSLDFTFSSTMEFGVQRYAAAERGSLVIPFESSGSGSVITSGRLNQTLDFTLDTNIYVFSLGDSIVSYDFSVQSTGLNVSTRSYSRDGANYCSFNGNDFNEVQIFAQSNSVRITDNGVRYAEVLQK